jgi:hypothetical protein
LNVLKIYNSIFSTKMPNLPGYYGISMTKYRPIINIYGKQVGNTYYSATQTTREQVV